MEMKGGLAHDVLALQWLFLEQGVDALQRQCAVYSSSKQVHSLFRLTLQVDPSKLCEHSADLGAHLLHKPSLMWQLLHKLCFTIIQTAEWLPALKNPSQMLLLIRLTSMPDLPDYVVQSVRDVSRHAETPHFVQLTGVLCSIGARMHYTQSATFRCPRTECPGATREAEGFVRLHSVGKKEAELTRRKPCCPHCGEMTVEDVTCRSLSEKTVVRLVPVQALNMATVQLYGAEGMRHQAFSVVLRDDLCSELKLGAEYSVIGVAVPQDVEVPSWSDPSGHATMPVMVEANNIFPASSPQLSSQPMPQMLSQKLLDIHKACSYSAWTFSASMAYSFAAEIVPPGLYHRLKLGILLSLVLCGRTRQREEDTQPRSLNILAMDSDPQLVLKLFAYAATLSPRSVTHSSGCDLLGSVRKDAEGMFIDGGSLILASDGVCLVGNLNVKKKDTVDKLQRALESRQVVLDVPPKSQGEALDPTSWPLECNVWACADQGKKMAASHGVELLKQHSLHEVATVSKALADGFTLVMLTQVSDTNEYAEQELMDHFLLNAMGQPRDPPLDKQDFVKLLDYAQTVTPVFSTEARSVIQSFYSASRRVRASSVHGTDMPLTGLDALTSLAEAHAMLSLRREVIARDAVMAILLYEESLVDRFGYSVLNISPCPHFKSDKAGSYIGLEFDQWMCQVEKMVYQFCKCHAPSVGGGGGPPHSYHSTGDTAGHDGWSLGLPSKATWTHPAQLGVPYTSEE